MFDRHHLMQMFTAAAVFLCVSHMSVMAGETLSSGANFRRSIHDLDTMVIDPAVCSLQSPEQYDFILGMAGHPSDDDDNTDPYTFMLNILTPPFSRGSHVDLPPPWRLCQKALVLLDRLSRSTDDALANDDPYAEEQAVIILGEWDRFSHSQTNSNARDTYNLIGLNYSTQFDGAAIVNGYQQRIILDYYRKEKEESKSLSDPFMFRASRDSNSSGRSYSESSPIASFNMG